MAIKNFWRKQEPIKKHSYAIGESKHDKLQRAMNVQEQFKGIVEQKQDKFNKNLGEPHPFDYAITKGLYCKMSFVNGVVDKIVNKVWGPGTFTKSENERAKEIIDQWWDDVKFSLHGRKWLKQALIKGFSPLELGGKAAESPQGVKVLNADRVFIQRNDKGELLKVLQLKPGRLGNKEDDFVPFEPFQVAILNINQVDDEAYGYGVLYPQLETINHLLSAERDMHKLLMRKANTPIVATLGTEAEPPTQEEVDSMADKLTYMNNKTEWAVGANVKLGTIDFGNIGEKFEGVLKHDEDMLMFGLQLPEVIMGRGSIPEGLAGVQQEEVDRYAASLQEELEHVIESQIFRRILQANGLDAVVELEWGQPSKQERNDVIAQLQLLLNNPMLSPGLRLELEKKLASLLDISEEVVEPPERQRDRELKEPQPRVPGQNEMLYEGTLLWN